MRYDILQDPDFGMLRLTFERGGEQVVSEAGAMVAHSPGIAIETNMRGGLMQAAKRRLLGGESIFQNTYTATEPDQELFLSPPPEGDVKMRQLEKEEEFYLVSGAYLAHTQPAKIDTRWAGVKGLFGGVGFFLLKLAGPGAVFFNSYGAIHEVEVGPEGYICDNGHIVGFTSGLDYDIRKFGGFKGLLFSGEGLVCHFRGRGRVYLQTRNPPALAGFLEPFRRVRQSRD
jgi:uncharacterized protein (TIGR00266 family)